VGKEVVSWINVMCDPEMIREGLIRRQLIQISEQRIGTDLEFADLGFPDKKTFARFDRSPSWNRWFLRCRSSRRTWSSIAQYEFRRTGHNGLLCV
jgi:hypothetical protein